MHAGAPIVSPRWISRPHLLARLAHARIAVLCAPAGYGKTILAAQYAATQETCGWLNLSPALQQDETQLLSALLSACLGEERRAAPGVVFDDPLALIEWLLTALRACTKPRLLVLDGADALGQPRMLQALRHFVHRLPPQLRLLVTLRDDRALAWHPLYISQSACRLGHHDLEWKDGELDELARQSGLSVNPHRRAWLGRWPAAVSLWLQARGLEEELASSCPTLLDYCMQERIQLLPPAARHALFSHAPAGRMPLHLLHERLGERAQSVLAEWTEAALASLEGDDESSCLLFPPLIVDAVERHLRRWDPLTLKAAHTMAALDARKLGKGEQALRFATRARDADIVLDILIELGWDLYLDGHSGLVRHAMEMLEPDVARHSPELLLLYLKVHLQCGEIAWTPRPPAEWGAVLKRVASGAAHFADEEKQRFEAGLACIRAQRALALADTPIARECARTLQPEQAPTCLQAAAWGVQAELAALEGELPRAAHYWAQALQRARSNNHQCEALWYFHQLAETEAALGEVQRAYLLRQEALQRARNQGIAPIFTYWCLLRGHAELCIQMRRREESEAALAQLERDFSEQREAAVALDILRARFFLGEARHAAWEACVLRLAHALPATLHPYLRVRLEQALLEYWLLREEKERVQLWLNLLPPLSEAGNEITQYDGRNRLRAFGFLEQREPFSRLWNELYTAASRLPVDSALLQALAWEHGLEGNSTDWLPALLRYGQLAELQRLAREQAARWNALLRTYPELIGQIDGWPAPASPLPAVGGKDRRLLQCLEQGLSNEWIAQNLHMAVGTVKNRLSQLYRRLGVSNRAEALQWWRAHRDQVH